MSYTGVFLPRNEVIHGPLLRHGLPSHRGEPRPLAGSKSRQTPKVPESEKIIKSWFRLYSVHFKGTTSCRVYNSDRIWHGLAAPAGTLISAETETWSPFLAAEQQIYSGNGPSISPFPGEKTQLKPQYDRNEFQFRSAAVGTGLASHATVSYALDSSLALLLSHGAIWSSCVLLPADPNDAKYQRLLEMGFDPAKTRAALTECKGDEGAAISKLLSQG